MCECEEIIDIDFDLRKTYTLIYNWNAVFWNWLFALDLNWCHRVNGKYLYEIVIIFLKVDLYTTKMIDFYSKNYNILKK